MHFPIPQVIRPAKTFVLPAVFLVAAFACLAAISRFMTTSTAQSKSGESVITTDFVRRIPVVTNDIVYSPVTNRLYATVPSSGGANGNSVTTINPATGSITNSVFIGSEPNKLALADDGQTLYAALDGAFSIRRFDAATQTPGLKFSLLKDNFFGRYVASDLAVAPGTTNLVAVARQYLGLSPPEAGVAVFDNGVQRPNTGPGHVSGSDYLAFSASASKLYGSSQWGTLRTMTIDGSGVTQTGTPPPFTVGTRIKFHNGLIYSSTGQVINPDTGTLLGTFSGANSTAFVADSSVGRAYYLMSNGNGTFTLKAYDLQTFLPIDTSTISGVFGQPSTMVRWGSNGLAFRTENKELYVIQTVLIPSPDPVPTPTPTPASTPTPSPTPFAAFVQQVPLVTNDVIYNQASQKLFVSVPSAGGSNGNSVATIDPATAAIGTSVWVGSEPAKLAPSDDGHTLYVGLNGAGAIRQFDMTSLTAGSQFSLGIDNFNGPLTANDIAVAPGSPNVIAVTRNSFQGGVAIFDNGVQRPNTAQGSDSLAYSDSASTLYWGSSTLLTTGTVDNNGITTGTSAPFGGNPIKFANGLVYGGSGQVVNPATGDIVGTFSGIGFGSNPIAVDLANGRVFFISSGIFGNTLQLRAYDINTFVPIGFVDFPNMFGPPTSLVRWGTNGLAFRTSTRVVILRTSLVNASDPVPAATPTPSPTPSPSPAYIPTLVRRVNLPANDLVVSPGQTLYASVPGSVVGNGNSITSINTGTASVGTSTFVGSEPNRLALSDDGRTLYVSLDGAAAIRKFDLQTQAAGLQFSWGTNFLRPADMEVVPGAPQSLAVSDGNGGGFGVAIYDDGVQRPNASKGQAYAIGPLEFGSSPTVLYGYDSYSSGFELVKFTLDSSGVTASTLVRNLLTGFTNGMEFSNGLLYSGSGRVANPETSRLAGTFQNVSFSSAIVVDASLGRAFFISGSGSSALLTAFDINTFLPIGSLTIPNVDGTPASLVRWGTNGLAFRTQTNFSPNFVSKVYLIQSELVSNATPVPTAVQFSSPTANVIEGNPSVTLTVNRSGDVSTTTTVNYATGGGTATAGSDYTVTSGTLTFDPGQLSKTITVPIINENLYEVTAETFNVTLSNPSAGVMLLDPSNTVVTISDFDQQPVILIGNISLAEGNSGTKVFSFPVTLSNPSIQTISVNFATANGTATDGSDYVGTTGTVTFNPTETSKTISVTVNGDTTLETNETFFINLTNAINVSSLDNQALGTILNDDTPAFKFELASYTATENAPSVSVVVTRGGDPSIAATVDYATNDFSGVPANDLQPARCHIVNGNASGKCDYATAGGRLRFAANESSKTIVLSIVDDVYVEGDELLSIALSNPSSGSLVSPSSTTIAIQDNDTNPNPSNPYVLNPFFVRQQYLDFLLREPDTAGYNDWLTVLNNCNPNQGFLGAPPECDRVHVSSGFFRSPEFGERGYWVYRFFSASLGRRPFFAEFTPQMRRLSGLKPQADLAADEADFINEFMQRPEFINIYSGVTDAAHASEFITRLEQKAGVTLPASVPPTQPGQPPQYNRQDLINLMENGTLSPAKTLRAFVEQKVVWDAYFFKAFVAMEYFGYLRRDPEAAGYDDWVDVLTNGRASAGIAPGDFRHLVFGFLYSEEYRERFGPK